MSKKVSVHRACTDTKQARLGGDALIGGIAAWPATPDGTPLSLLLSLPASFLNDRLGLTLPADHYVSVFSFYSKTAYFLEYITYHGDPSELALLSKGYTRVLLHPEGSPVSEGSKIPAMCIDVDDAELSAGAPYQGSKIGGAPGLLQAEALALDGQRFGLQVHGNDFPAPYTDALFLSDAVGYLFVDPRAAPTAGCSHAGTFFVQVA